MRIYWRGSGGDAGVELIRTATCLILLILASPLLAHAAADNALSRADQLLAQERHAEACQLYERAIMEGAKLESDLLRSRNLARCYLNQSPPRLNEAIRWLQNAVRLDPAAEDVRDFLAQTLVRANNFNAAAGQYFVLSQAHPGTADYVLGLVGALRQAGRAGEALRTLKGALEHSPNLTSVRLEYANALSRSQQLQTAKEQYRLVLTADPGNPTAVLGLATIASQQGEHQRAFELYNQALQQHPNLYEAWAGKGLCLLRMGRKQEAVPVLIAALKRNPDDAHIRNALREVGVNPNTAFNANDRPSRGAQTSPGAPHGAQSAEIATPGVPVSQPTGAGSARRTFSNAAVTEIANLLPRRTTAVGILTVLVVLLCSFRAIVRRRERSHTKAELVSLHLSEAEPVVAPSCEAANNSYAHDVSSELRAGEECNWIDEVVAEVRASNAQPTRSTASMNGLRIIIVGGRMGLRQLELSTLQSAGLKVESVDNFPQALLRWLAHPDAVVLLNEQEDGSWDIERIHSWILENRPDWIDRTVFAISNPERFPFAKANNLVHLPFDSNDVLECLSHFCNHAAEPKAVGL